MVRLSTTFIAFLLLASILAAGPGTCGTTEKARILSELSTSPTRAAAKVKSGASDASELALDLIVYRWTSHESVNLPTDVDNIDAVITALSNSLNDQVIRWGSSLFSISNPAATAAPPAGNDPRIAQLSEFKRQFGIALEFRDSSPIQSVTALNAALDIGQKLQLDITNALIQTLLGRQYHYGMARYAQAEYAYGYAVTMFSMYDCGESVALLSHNYGALCSEMSRFSAATQNYSLAARQWVALSKRSPTVSRYREMAGKEYILAGQAQAKAGDPDKALQLMEEGINQLQGAADMTKSYSNLISNLITVSDLYRDQGNLPKTLDLLQRADKATQFSTDPLLNAEVHDRLNVAYRATNLMVKASSELEKRDNVLTDAAEAGQAAVKKLSTDTSAPAESSLLLTAQQGASALQELKRYPEAAAALQSVIDIYKKDGKIDQQIQCLRSLAAVMDLQQAPQQSLDARMQAAMLAMKTNKKAVAAEIVREMVQVFIAIGDLNNALDTLSDLAPIMEQSGNVRGAADVLEGRGTLLASHGRYDAAILDFKDALTKYSTQVGDPWAAAAVSVKLASALEADGKTTDACPVLESSIKDIETRYADENVDPNTNSERSRLMLSLYKELVEVYVEIGKSSDATGLVAKARRYQWVGDLVSELKESKDTAVAGFAKTVDVLGATTSASPSDASGKQTLLARDWAEFSAKSRMLREQYAARYNALPINPQELYKSRNDLPRKALVIEYMVTDYSTFAFVCGNGKSSIWEIGVSAKELDALTTSLRKCIRDCEQSLSAGIPLPKINDWREPTFIEFRDPMVSLNAKLLAPIASELSPDKMLVFVLPEELDGLPMHALITGEKDGVPRFLVQDYAVGYLGEDMLGDLISKDSRPIDPSSDRLAIFADPAGNLPGAKAEASMLERLYYDSFAYVGKRATVDNFIKECNRAGILHIAVHYKADPNPSKFVLQLAPEGDSDGEITLQELTSIANPSLQLVALSACESAASADPLLSGTSCAAEVFSLAGAKSVLGGIWKVPDASTTKLMGDFYRSLAKGNTRAESLRRAQAAMIDAREYAHPFYWACFALYGNPW